MGTTTISRRNGKDWAFYVTEPITSDVTVTIVAVGSTHYHGRTTNLNEQYFTVGVTTCADWGTHFSAMGDDSDGEGAGEGMDQKSVYFHTAWEDEIVQKKSTKFPGSFIPSCANQMTITVDHFTRSLIALDATGREVHRTSFVCLGGPNEKGVRLFVGLGSVMGIRLN